MSERGLVRRLSQYGRRALAERRWIPDQARNDSPGGLPPNAAVGPLPRGALTLVEKLTRTRGHNSQVSPVPA